MSQHKWDLYWSNNAVLIHSGILNLNKLPSLSVSCSLKVHTESWYLLKSKSIYHITFYEIDFHNVTVCFIFLIEFTICVTKRKNTRPLTWYYGQNYEKVHHLLSKESSGPMVQYKCLEEPILIHLPQLKKKIISGGYISRRVFLRH